MKPLPPGVPFLARGLLALSFYPLLIVASARLFHRFAGLAIPVWLLPLLALASVAASTAATIALRERRVRRAAARLGAVLPPRWDGRAIGHVDLLRSMVHEYKNGYIADNLMLKLGELGPTMQTNILWDRAYITTDPQAIKSILATDFANYVKGEAFDGYMRSVLGTGVFNSDGDMWKCVRV
ncbi:hypothetical protein AcV5_006422 [Taiwanofungus camphoratus]|nr:hypothetical protein AcV5_006422 [Antrodia cinnamomea]